MRRTGPNLRRASADDAPLMNAVAQQAYAPYLERMDGRRPGPMVDDYAALVENQRLYERIGYVETRRATEHGLTRVFYEKVLG